MVPISNGGSDGINSPLSWTPYLSIFLILSVLDGFVPARVATYLSSCLLKWSEVKSHLKNTNRVAFSGESLLALSSRTCGLTHSEY
jgi:K+-transporting ATPase A subunit